MKISKNAPPHRPWEEIAKSGTELLCTPTSSIILQSFNLVGHVIKEEIEKTVLNRRTDGHPTHFIRSSRRDDLKNAQNIELPMHCLPTSSPATSISLRWMSLKRDWTPWNSSCGGDWSSRSRDELP